MSQRRATNASRRTLPRVIASPADPYSPTSDDFSGASVDSKWTLTDTSNALASPPYQSGGSLFLPHNGTTATNYMSISPFQNAPRLTQPLDAGNADVRLLFVKPVKQLRFLRQGILFENAARNRAVILMLVTPNSTVNYRLQWGIYGNGGDVNVVNNNNATLYDNLVGLRITYNPTTGLYTGYYSNTAAPGTWLTVPTTPTQTPAGFTPAHVGFIGTRESGLTQTHEYTDWTAIPP